MRGKFVLALLTAVTLLAAPCARADETQDDAAQPRQAEPETRSTDQPPSTLANDAFDALASAVPKVDSPAIKAILAAHPGRDIILCLAGCRGAKHAIMWQRPSWPVGAALVAGLVSPSGAAGEMARPADDDAVVCIAGCDGPVGMVTFRGKRFAWIGGDGRADLASSLAEMGRRLAASLDEEAQAGPRAWVGGTARANLMSAFTGDPVRTSPRAEVGLTRPKG